MQGQSEVYILKGEMKKLNSTLLDEYQQAIKTYSGKQAVYSNEISLSFDDFDLVVNHIADHLCQNDSKFVFLVTDRNIFVPLFFWACQKADKVYSPIEISLPSQRIREMIEGVSNVEVYSTGDVAIEGHDIISTALFNIEDILHKQNKKKASPVNKHDHAFLLYTSGTTGVPKGILGSGIGLYNRMSWMRDKFEINENDKIMFKTPISFDVHLWEIIVPFISGASLFILAPEEHKLINRVIKWIKKEKITRVHFVPSVLKLFMKFLKQPEELFLKSVFSSGEALSATDAKLFYEKVLNAELVNLYGPAEASVDVTYYILPSDKSLTTVPIGEPIPNVELYVLDNEQKFVAVGEEGELYLSGIALASGYTSSELTHEKFLDNPFRPGNKMYRTGDIVKVDKNKNILYLGRADSQVKVNGVRIELKEVEKNIIDVENVEDVAVLFDQNENSLKAFIVGDVNSEIIKSHLLRQLPKSYIPSNFYHIDKIPLSLNGKRDDKALLSLSRSHLTNT